MLSLPLLVHGGELFFVYELCSLKVPVLLQCQLTKKKYHSLGFSGDRKLVYGLLMFPYCRRHQGPLWTH